ncbi:sensor domain-containing diguanylate cyclase [Photobacterium sp. TY1-4]|uniref:sensor domain-containing diguanylate cyclase n=1 Tax=Photobacterium sp. TY1-4 TaxID=2899122 RepID=UPI0021BFBBA7|nr:sensor domain-containing diguanylate cyclase [Photobacterium sp. TY1-4]UXI03387.1 sensor domain-containing diguanylate cyclase [Photobacterium sp. TY1-4]
MMMNIQDNYLKSELYQLLNEEAGIFEFLQDGSLDGLWYWDLENPEHEWMNERFWTLLGYDPSEKKHLAAEWQDLIFPEDLEAAMENFRKHSLDPTHPYDQIVRYKHKNGSTVWVRCRGVAIRDQSGKPVRMLGSHNDLTAYKQVEEELKQKNRELEKLACRDPLTSLYNRRIFHEMLEKELAKSARYQTPLSIAIIDIDNFKAINDNWGHQEGDHALCTVSTTLTNTARHSDVVARLAGDEFIILMYQTDETESKAAGERYRASVEHGRVTVSIGLTTFVAPAELEKSGIHELSKCLIAQADKALYQAKANGRNCAHHFADCHDTAPAT